ncbi:hypothetical protein HHK36_006225 [Tetracentron sinense]|uniref:Uncharacterized protein n=1 Tax=Tetracentron sinense TaxID=13715 RepID=A0A834ZK18_TETSI|nr:hypothetical protein HHK36_006225 [Tetracentron sinense]
MPKNNSKAKSARKPLMDISNGGKSSKPVKKKISENEGQVESDPLDRLLLVHSDLSTVIHQIDELVVQAFQLNLTSKKGRKEIESFTNVLSDMCSSLKPWVPRFQKALSSMAIESENQLGASKTVPAADEKLSNVVDSPKQSKTAPLVSPSPLVSWRADCTVERGRQLFLLTPLPRSRALSSKCQGLSRSVFERITDMHDPPNTTLGLPPLLTISGDTNDDLLERVEIKPTPGKISDSAITQMESTPECGFVSPPKFSNRDHTMFLMTPRLKMSPPKSCVLLEPISESSHQDNDDIPKPTPFPVGIQNYNGPQTFESSSSQDSKKLALKYPELFGLQPIHKIGIGRKDVETSLDWFMSPPKTCVLMEPPNVKSLINAATNSELPTTNYVLGKQTMCLSSAIENDLQGRCQSTKGHCNKELLSASLVFPESTPLWKESESTIQTGKRPGENTLKKELWTKFEAASTNELGFDVSVFQETTRKGFLDRLEEVSCEDSNSVPNGFQ